MRIPRKRFEIGRTKAAQSFRGLRGQWIALPEAPCTKRAIPCRHRLEWRRLHSRKSTMNAASIVPVILSGGAGTRLWPLSREAAPKPFMPLPDGETLLAKTAARAMALPGAGHLITITNRDYYFHTKDVYAGIGGPQPRSAAYLLEPFGR